MQGVLLRSDTINLQIEKQTVFLLERTRMGYG